MADERSYRSSFPSIVTSDDMRALDHYATHHIGIPPEVLMENAGRAAFERAKKIEPQLSRKTISVFCGPGNNGGDGFVFARYGLLLRAHVFVWIISPSGKGPSTQESSRFLSVLQAMGAHVRHVTSPEVLENAWKKDIEGSQILVDAIFGVGLSRKVEPPFSDWITWMNELRRKTKHKTVLSLDLPSGLHADSGQVLGAAIKADATITFTCKKRGMYVGDGPAHTGTVFKEDISIDSRWLERIHCSETYETKPHLFKSWYPKKAYGAHKGNFGRVVIVAGSPEKSGAAVLTTLAALRSGAGLVTLAVPRSAHTIIKRQLVEAMSEELADANGALSLESLEKISPLLRDADVCAMGPGLKPTPVLRDLVLKIFDETRVPLVLDAEALNALEEDAFKINQKNHKELVLTPHPGELARMTKRNVEDIQSSRFETVRDLCQEGHVTLLLKGAYSLIGSSRGQIWVNPTGNNLLAAGGMGDVLTGLIAGLIAQGVSPLHSTVISAYFHGMAADKLEQTKASRGILATEVMDAIPGLMKDHGF